MSPIINQMVTKPNCINGILAFIKKDLSIINLNKNGKTNIIKGISKTQIREFLVNLLIKLVGNFSSLAFLFKKSKKITTNIAIKKEIVLVPSPNTTIKIKNMLSEK